MKVQPSPFERYQMYVKKLEQEGGKFPVNQFGEVNFTKIAAESSNRRQWFTESGDKKFGVEGKTLSKIIKEDVKRVGTCHIPPRNPDEELSRIVEKRSKETNYLRQMLEQKTKENEQLRQENKKMRVKLCALENSLAEHESRHSEMLDSGRRFNL